MLGGTKRKLNLQSRIFEEVLYLHEHLSTQAAHLPPQIVHQRTWSWKVLHSITKRCVADLQIKVIVNKQMSTGMSYIF